MLSKFLLSLLILTTISLPGYGKDLIVFSGAAGRPPLEEVAKIFERVTGVKVRLIFSGSGVVLSQMALSPKSDVYFPASSEFMEIAKRKGLVFPETERRVAFLVPAIVVQKGNPKGIRGLRDLIRPGIRLVLANPEVVALGVYAVEIIESNLSDSEKALLKKNIVTYMETCEKVATAVSLKMVDAAIGWEVFQHWDPNRIESIPLRKEEIKRIGYMPVAISTRTTNKQLGLRFIDFLLSDQGKRVFRKFNYFATPEEAFAWVGEKKPIGGVYVVPGEWVK